MKLLLIAEHDNQSLKPATLHTLTAAKQLTTEIDVLVLGNQCQSVVEQASKMNDVKSVLSADNVVYEHQLAENSAKLIAELVKDYTYIVSSAGTFGKNLLPRVAALIDVQMVSDITKVISKDTFERPIYAGNVIATVQSLQAINVISVRASAFAEDKLSDTANATIIPIKQVIESKLTRFESHQLTQSSRPELSNAKIVVSGGRGLKSAENFKLLEALADQLNAAIGASRAAVDAGFAPNDYQVGQTGKIVAPELYIAIGISGAIQHLAGMKDSKVIVAINNDPEAPIFEVADYGLVGDLFSILPELKSELDKVMAA